MLLLFFKWVPWKSPPMLLPQASRVRPSTVLLRLHTTPSMCSRLTTSEAVALISTALTTKPKRANACGNAPSSECHTQTHAETAENCNLTRIFSFLSEKSNW